MIKVIWNHEDALVLDSLRRMLSSEPDIEIAAETNTIADMLTQVETHQPDVIILDAVLPDGDILEVIQRLEALSSSPKLLILSTLSDALKIGEILMVGVLGFCSRCDDPTLIPAAVRAIAAGLPCTSPTVRRRLLALALTVDAMRAETTEVVFTRQEQRVLQLFAQGFGVLQTASIMGLVERTVRHYMDKIRAKTGLNSREEIIVYAVKQGYGRKGDL